LLSAGQKADCESAEALVQGARAKGLIADKGYDTNALRRLLRDARMEAVIPPKRNRREALEYDKERYKERNLIERCFGKLKQHRRLATRYDRNDAHYTAFLFLAASLLWL
jgi:transposase